MIVKIIDHLDSRTPPKATGRFDSFYTRPNALSESVSGFEPTSPLCRFILSHATKAYQVARSENNGRLTRHAR